MERLEQTGKTYIINGKTVKARKKTNNKWFETQDSISYWEDFFKPKIIYNDITQRLSFALCENSSFLNNTAYFFASNDFRLLTYLLGILNSNLINWYYRTLSVQLGEKAVRMFSIYVMNIPVPKDITPIKSEEDVYQLYSLSSEEIAYMYLKED